MLERPNVAVSKLVWQSSSGNLGARASETDLDAGADPSAFEGSFALLSPVTISKCSNLEQTASTKSEQRAQRMPLS
jgi:hypothetical protein